MDAKSFLDQLLTTGRDLALQGKDAAEKTLGVPETGEQREAMLSGMGKGAAMAGVLALLLGTGAGRRATGTAVKLGSFAAIAGLAYQGYRNWQSKQAGQPPPTPPQLDTVEEHKRSLGLLKAMIAAAKADGHIDQDEQMKIDQAIGKLDLDTEILHFIKAEIHRPLDVKEVAAGVDSTEMAAQVYLASRTVIDVQSDQEKAYLDELATHLGLSPDLVAELDTQLGG